MKSLFMFLCALALFREVAGAGEPKAPRPTLFLIGDSTVKNGTRGQQGWGELLAAHFDTNKIRIANHAIGGRSSRTFLTEGRWDRVREELHAGDFVLIQFGHNDGGKPDDKERPRGSLRGTGEETREILHPVTQKPEVVRTYGWYLRKCVREARERGATPIVCSPVPRNLWKEGRVARATNDFGRWAAEVARAENVSFLDLNQIIADRYEGLGGEKVKELFYGDHTHTSPEGAKLSAVQVVSGLDRLPGAPLRPFRRLSTVQP